MFTEMERKLVAMVGALQLEVDTLKEEVHMLKQKMLESGQAPGIHSEAVRRGVSAGLLEAGDAQSGINEVREHIKTQLKSLYPQLMFTNGGRSTGKLTISDGAMMIEKVLIRTSKSHRIQEGYTSGWLIVYEKQLTGYELFIFTIKAFDRSLHTFVMNREEIGQWAASKEVDSKGNFHFYVNNIHGRWIDDRHVPHYDCSRYYNNWATVGMLLDKKGMLEAETLQERIQGIRGKLEELGKKDNHRHPEALSLSQELDTLIKLSIQGEKAENKR